MSDARDRWLDAVALVKALSEGDVEGAREVAYAHRGDGFEFARVGETLARLVADRDEQVSDLG